MEEKDITVENGIDKIIIESRQKVLPMVALRGKVLFPKTFLNFDVGRAQSISAIEKATETGSEIFIATQKNSLIETPKTTDVFSIGVVAKIKQIIKLPTGNMKVSVEALYRAKIVNFVDTKNYFTVNTEEIFYRESENEYEVQAYLRLARAVFNEYLLFDKRVPKDMVVALEAIDTPNEFVNNAISIVNFKEKDVQAILESDDTIERLKAFEELFTKELEILKIENTFLRRK